MKEFKTLFKNSRLGLGAAIGTTIGYVVHGIELDGVFGIVMVISLIVIVAENMILRSK